MVNVVVDMVMLVLDDGLLDNCSSFGPRRCNQSSPSVGFVVISSVGRRAVTSAGVWRDDGGDDAHDDWRRM